MSYQILNREKYTLFRFLYTHFNENVFPTFINQNAYTYKNNRLR